MKNEKGITLIALIIIVIIMLILVAVTIRAAMDGGLIGNARNARSGTQRSAAKEQLISAMVGGYNSKGKFVANDVDLPKGTTWCTEEETSYETAVEVATAERNWIITENGDKFYIDNVGSVLDEKPVSIYDIAFSHDINQDNMAKSIFLFRSNGKCYELIEYINGDIKGFEGEYTVGNKNNYVTEISGQYPDVTDFNSEIIDEVILFGGNYFLAFRKVGTTLLFTTPDSNRFDYLQDKDFDISQVDFENLQEPQ